MSVKDTSLPSQHSMRSTHPHHTDKVSGRPHFHSIAIADPDFALETFLTTLQMSDYMAMDEEQRKHFLEKIDALDLFTAMQEINRELASVKLENHYLADFLEKNDPRLLVGLKQRRATASISRRLTATSNTSGRSSIQNVGISSSRRSLKSATQSIYTSGSAKKDKADYHLNYRAKIDMADKAATEVERRMRELQIKSMRDIKLLKARIEELRFRYEETKETSKNFQLHFLRDEFDIAFLESATEKQLERKLRKFLTNWMKNARALLSTMRLRITSLQESCQQHRSDLITKADLSGILGAVDFEQLIIKRSELLNSLDDKNAHMQGLKGVTGKASLAMSEEKQVMMAIEEESKRISNKTVEVIKVISKIEKEARMVEEENKKDLKTLRTLQEQLEHYEAPSVNQYIEKKDETTILEKEEKMLHRKTYILNMKLNNIIKKFKKMEE